VKGRLRVRPGRRALARTIDGGADVVGRSTPRTSDDLQGRRLRLAEHRLRARLGRPAAAHRQLPASRGRSSTRGTGGARAPNAVRRARLQARAARRPGRRARRSFDGGQSFRHRHRRRRRGARRSARPTHVGPDRRRLRARRGSSSSRNGGKSWRAVKPPAQEAAHPGRRPGHPEHGLPARPGTAGSGARWTAAKSWGERARRRAPRSATTSPSPDARHGFLSVTEFGDDSHGYVLRTADGGARRGSRSCSPRSAPPRAASRRPARTTGFRADARQPPAGHAHRRLGRREVLAADSRRRPGTSRRPGTVRIDGPAFKGARGRRAGGRVLSARRARRNLALRDGPRPPRTGTFTVVAARVRAQRPCVRGAVGRRRGSPPGCGHAGRCALRVG